MRPQQLVLRRYLWRAIEVASLLVLVILLCFGFALFLPYILPFVVAWFFAILLLPLVRLIERTGIPRVVAVLIVMVAVGALVALASTFIVIALFRETTTLSHTLPNYFLAIQTWAQNKIAASKAAFGQLPPQLANSLQTSVTHLLTATEQVFQVSATTLVGALTRLPEWTFLIVISVIATYFMLSHHERMYHAFLRMLPPGWEEKVDIVTGDMLRAFTGTIRVQVALMIMSAVLGIAGLWIMRVNYAVLFGLLFGVTGMIPIVGSALVSIPWAAGALVMGNITVAIKVILLQVFISVVRHIVEPKILADNVGLDTLSTLFALYVGMKVIGILGLFLGPIVLIGIKSLLRLRLFSGFFPDYDAAVADAGKPSRGAGPPGQAPVTEAPSSTPEEEPVRETD